MDSAVGQRANVGKNDGVRERKTEEGKKEKESRVTIRADRQPPGDGELSSTAHAAERTAQQQKKDPFKAGLRKGVTGEHKC